ncbi:MAG: hypothetical protein AB2L14_04365 [Candidatus Xenobiia bacterium LiM19]
MKKMLIVPLLILALAGFTLSLLAHILSFFDVDVQSEYPYVWLLHIGIFVVFIPAILFLKKRRQNDILARTSPAFRVLAFALFIYAFFNFFFTIFLLKQGGCNPVSENGTYYLKNKGHIVREISENEYEKQRAYDVRLFSGHWMIFYLFGAAMLYTAIKEEEKSYSL